MTPIPADHFTASLNHLIREAFDGPASHGEAALLNPGGGLLPVLGSLSAEAASRPPAGGGATVAAHVLHVRYYLDVLRKLLTGKPQEVDWERSWRVQQVTDADWAAQLRGLREDYAALQLFVEEPRGWDPKSLGICMAMLAHTTYHLGAIRQVLRSVS